MDDGVQGLEQEWLLSPVGSAMGAVFLLVSALIMKVALSFQVMNLKK